MPAIRRARTRIQRNGARRARTIRSHLAQDVLRAREDAGLSQRALGRAAGVSSSTVSMLERGAYDPATEVLARVGEVLGLDLSVRFYPGTGPLIRDHLQTAMMGQLLAELHARWHPLPEVWVAGPAHGVIDLVLEPDLTDEPLVAVEAQSELRRLEQQVRWAHAKADALKQARGRPVSLLLLLRNTRRSRATVSEHARFMAAAYPARAAAAYAALTGAQSWPGPALLWADVAGTGTRIRPTPPRSINVGR